MTAKRCAAEAQGQAKYGNNVNYGFKNPRSQANGFVNLRSRSFIIAFPKRESYRLGTGSSVNNTLTQTDWRRVRLKCTQHVLTLPTNLRRPLPWRRSRSAGRPPSLVTWPLTRGRA